MFNGPVIIYNYPKQIKAFYMRRNDDGKTVAAMDLIIPKIGTTLFIWLFLIVYSSN